MKRAKIITSFLGILLFGFVVSHNACGKFQDGSVQGTSTGNPLGGGTIDNSIPSGQIGGPSLPVNGFWMPKLRSQLEDLILNCHPEFDRNQIHNWIDRQKGFATRLGLGSEYREWSFSEIEGEETSRKQVVNSNGALACLDNLMKPLGTDRCGFLAVNPTGANGALEAAPTLLEATQGCSVFFQPK